MYDLWAEASADHDAEEHERRIAAARARLQHGPLPFLLGARTYEEYVHRRSLADGQLTAIASASGLSHDQMRDLADAHYGLYYEAVLQHQALPEGEDPLLDLAQQSQHGSGFGAGPERPDQHSEGPDYSGGYSEVPQGAPGGPDPQVVTPVFPEPEPLAQLTSAMKVAFQVMADDTQTGGEINYTAPPDMGTGMGSTDVGVAGEAGPPSIPAGGAPMSQTPLTPPSIGQVTSSADPVYRQVLAVTASVQAANPWLPDAECARVAREAVGRYFTAATDWGPTMWNDSPPSQSSGDGGGGGLGSAVEHGLEWQGLKSLIPGGGAAGAGEAAGGAADLAELAPLAAL